MTPPQRVGRSSSETTILDGLFSSSRNPTTTTQTTTTSRDGALLPPATRAMPETEHTKTTATEGVIIVVIVVAVVLCVAACCCWCLVRFCGCCPCGCLRRDADPAERSQGGTLRLWGCCLGCLRWCCVKPQPYKAAVRPQHSEYPPAYVVVHQPNRSYSPQDDSGRQRHSPPRPVVVPKRVSRKAPFPPPPRSAPPSPGDALPQEAWVGISRDSSGASLLSNGYIEIAPDANGEVIAMQGTINPLYQEDDAYVETLPQ